MFGIDNTETESILALHSGCVLFTKSYWYCYIAKVQTIETAGSLFKIWVAMEVTPFNHIVANLILCS